MSEQVPEPEYEPKEKIQCSCWKCNHIVKSSLANCSNTVYTKQPWNTYTALACMDEQCQAVTVLFHDQLNDKSIATAMQYPTSIFEYCDQPDILEVRKTCVDAHDMEAHDISQRVESMITHWGEFLQRVVVDETDFGVGNEAA